ETGYRTTDVYAECQFGRVAIEVINVITVSGSVGRTTEEHLAIHFGCQHGCTGVGSYGDALNFVVLGGVVNVYAVEFPDVFRVDVAVWPTHQCFGVERDNQSTVLSKHIHEFAVICSPEIREV